MYSVDDEPPDVELPDDDPPDVDDPLDDLLDDPPDVDEPLEFDGSFVVIVELEVFEFDDEGMSKVVNSDVPSDLEADVKEAVESCPTAAIEEE